MSGKLKYIFPVASESSLRAAHVSKENDTVKLSTYFMTMFWNL